MLAVLIGSTGISYAQGIWFPTDKINCQIWNPQPFPEETATWSGDCLNGKAHGIGRTTWKNKKSGKWVERYIDGDVRNGIRSGIQTITYENGSLYTGPMNANGNRHGQGTINYASGSKYTGEWKNGKKNGQGTYTHYFGTIKEGVWKDNKFQFARKTPIAENNSSTNDIQSRLAKLKKLEDAGLITKDEAAKKRKAILDSI